MSFRKPKFQKEAGILIAKWRNQRDNAFHAQHGLRHKEG
jgi:hypothetical protein